MRDTKVHLDGFRVNQALQHLCYGQRLSREGSMFPKTDGILESSLYVSDLPRSVCFYEETFGFRVISEFGERGVNCTSRLLSHLPNWPIGNRGSK
jgi:hypothetical protein